MELTLLQVIQAEPNQPKCKEAVSTRHSRPFANPHAQELILDPNWLEQTL